jgi:hypothetical protein
LTKLRITYPGDPREPFEFSDLCYPMPRIIALLFVFITGFLSAQEEIEQEFETISMDSAVKSIFRVCPGCATDTLAGTELGFADSSFSTNERTHKLDTNEYSNDVSHRLIKQSVQYGKMKITMHADAAQAEVGYFPDSIVFLVNGVKAKFRLFGITVQPDPRNNLHAVFSPNPFRMRMENAVFYSSAKQKLLRVECDNIDNYQVQLTLLFDVTDKKQPKLVLFWDEYIVSDVNCDGIFELVKEEKKSETVSKGMIPADAIPSSDEYYYSRFTIFHSKDALNYVPLKAENGNIYEAVYYFYKEGDSWFAIIGARRWPY